MTPIRHDLSAIKGNRLDLPVVVRMDASGAFVDLSTYGSRVTFFRDATAYAQLTSAAGEVTFQTEDIEIEGTSYANKPTARATLPSAKADLLPALASVSWRWEFAPPAGEYETWFAGKVAIEAATPSI